jgi:hypothetical protein
VVGTPTTYTVRVTWTQERYDSHWLKVDNQLPRTDGCGSEETIAPAHHGPGSSTFTETVTFSDAGSHTLTEFAFAGCRYYQGYGAGQLTVVVRDASPSPSPQAS